MKSTTLFPAAARSSSFSTTRGPRQGITFAYCPYRGEPHAPHRHQGGHLAACDLILYKNLSAYDTNEYDKEWKDEFSIYGMYLNRRL